MVITLSILPPLISGTATLDISHLWSHLQRPQDRSHDPTCALVTAPSSDATCTCGALKRSFGDSRTASSTARSKSTEPEHTVGSDDPSDDLSRPERSSLSTASTTVAPEPSVAYSSIADPLRYLAREHEIGEGKGAPDPSGHGVAGGPDAGDDATADAHVLWNTRKWLLQWRPRKKNAVRAPELALLPWQWLELTSEAHGKGTSRGQIQVGSCCVSQQSRTCALETLHPGQAYLICVEHMGCKWEVDLSRGLRYCV